MKGGGRKSPLPNAYGSHMVDTLYMFSHLICEVENIAPFDWQESEGTKIPGARVNNWWRIQQSMLFFSLSHTVS